MLATSARWFFIGVAVLAIVVVTFLITTA